MSEPPEELGPYLVYEQLGSGGMATVHRAEARGVSGFRKPIALKRLHPHVAADEDLLKSFVHEARLAGFLHHTNIAQCYELGKAGETYFIAMEYVPGPTLTQIVRQCDRAAGPIPVPIVLSIVIQVCDALDYAHNLRDDTGKPLNLVHRDVSPSNIIVSNTGIVKLIDFGIAKAAISTIHTQTGFIKGKYGYVAPEYTLGHLDARADLFGIGVVAHELLAGRPLFLGRNDYETLTRLREMPVPRPSRWNPHVTPDLDDVIMTALQRDPANRWQSAAAMRTALTNITKELGIGVTQQQVFEWVEWAFSQVARPEVSGLARVIDTLDEPSIMVELPSRPEPSFVMELATRDVEFLNKTPGGRAPRSLAELAAHATPLPIPATGALNLEDTVAARPGAVRAATPPSSTPLPVPAPPGPAQDGRPPRRKQQSTGVLIVAGGGAPADDKDKGKPGKKEKTAKAKREKTEAKEKAKRTKMVIKAVTPSGGTARSPAKTPLDGWIIVAIVALAALAAILADLLDLTIDL